MHIEELALIDSTNSELLRRAAAGNFAHGHVLIAQAQSAGRGRSNRQWISPAGDAQSGNLYLSMMLELPNPIAQIAPLTLALGVAARRAIALDRVQLKWPNDLQIAGKKLGGILLEVAKTLPGASQLVAGIGINIRMPEQAGSQIDQHYTDLYRHGVIIATRDLAVRVTQQWLHAASEFTAQGLAGVATEFAQADALIGKSVQLSDAPEANWRAAGINADGALVLVNGDQRRLLRSGEASVRAEPLA